MSETVEISPEIISFSRAAWLDLVGQDVFVVEYERFFDVTLENSGAVFLAITQSGSMVADAFIEIISKPKSIKTKLLNITARPDLLDVNQHSNFDALRWLILKAIKATFDTAQKHEAEEVKIYGRSTELYEILTELAEIMSDEPIPGISHTMEGRWLTFYPKGA